MLDSYKGTKKDNRQLLYKLFLHKQIMSNCFDELSNETEDVSCFILRPRSGRRIKQLTSEVELDNSSKQ